MKQVVADFEAYAKQHYIAALGKQNTDHLIVLAGLRYVVTRRVKGLESRLKEIFTTRYTSKIGRSIDDTCLDALITTTEDPLANARFLAFVATLAKPLPTTPLAEKALLKLDSVAAEALLLELARPLNARQQRKLVRLLMRLTKVKPPVPISFWKQENQAQRKAMVNRLRRQVSARGFDVSPAVPSERTDRIMRESAAELAFQSAQTLLKRKRYAKALSAFEAIVRDFEETSYASQARGRVAAIQKLLAKKAAEDGEEE